MKKRVAGILFCLLLTAFCGMQGLEKKEQLQHQAAKEAEAKRQAELEQQKKEEAKPVLDPEKPMIAITFDDGPGKHTMRLLKVLEKYQVKATFFLVGESISKYPDAVKQMAKQGCEIGNHTQSHKNLTKVKAKGIRTQLGGTDKKVQDLTGKRPTLIRPPYGAVNATLRKTADRPLVFWSMDTLDWKKKDAKKVANYIMKHVEDGEVILVHDIHKTTVDAMEKVIPQLLKKGYQLVTVSELAQAREVKMEKGKKYFSFPAK